MRASDLPKPPGRLPLLGDLWRISSATPIQSELALTETVGSLYQLNLGGRGKDIVVTTDYRAISSIADEELWAKFLAAPFMVLRDSLTGRGLLTARTSDPAWQTAQTLLSPGFSKSALQQYHPIVVGAVQDLCSLWERSDGQPIDVARDMNRLTLEVIARTGFSSTFNALDQGADAAGFADDLTATLKLVSAVAHSVPGVAALRRRRLVVSAQRLRAAAERRVDEHRDSGGHTDLLDRMCPAHIDPGPLPRENVVEQCLTFLLAGNETTAGTLSFALHFLAQNPQLQQEIREEVAQFGEALSYSDVARLKATRRAVDESLRLWPVAPAYFRRARVDTSMDTTEFGLVDVPKNTVVMAHLVGAHRDTATWGSDAHEFRPSRFTSTELRAHPNRVYRPFGVGPRSCIGRGFALHEAVLALAGILARFEVIPMAGYELAVEEMITLKPKGLRVTVRRV